MHTGEVQPKAEVQPVLPIGTTADTSAIQYEKLSIYGEPAMNTSRLICAQGHVPNLIKKLGLLIIVVILLFPPIASSSTVAAAWGDSLTIGSGGTPWPEQFGALSGVTTLNRGSTGDTSTQIANRFLATPSAFGYFTVIWSGRNNYADTSTVKSDIALMIASLTTSNYLVLGVINGDFGGDESIGGAGYSLITQLNADLALTYGSRFIDIRSILVNSYDPLSPQDVIDFEQDIVPSSLRSDSIHLNTAGYGITADAVFAGYSSVPLPSAVWAFGSGLFMLIRIAKTKKSK